MWKVNTDPDGVAKPEGLINRRCDDAKFSTSSVVVYPSFKSLIATKENIEDSANGEPFQFSADAKERGCVVLDQPQPLHRSRGSEVPGGFLPAGRDDTTAPRSLSLCHAAWIRD
jgi:hypothetical protein